MTADPATAAAPQALDAVHLTYAAIANWDPSRDDLRLPALAAMRQFGELLVLLALGLAPRIARTKVSASRRRST